MCIGKRLSLGVLARLYLKCCCEYLEVIQKKLRFNCETNHY